MRRSPPLSELAWGTRPRDCPPPLRRERVAEPALKTGFPSQATGVGVPPVVATPVGLSGDFGDKSEIQNLR